MAGKPKQMIPPLSERRLVVRLVPFPSDAHRQRAIATLNEFREEGRRIIAAEALKKTIEPRSDLG